MYAKIAGTGSCLPQNILDNHAISKMVDTSDEWIKGRTGVCKRHIAKEETVVSLAVSAAKEAIKDAKISPEDIDLIIVSTVSAEQLLPCVACEVQAYIGAAGAACFDLNAACTGFITAYQVAASQMKAGMIRTALIIGAEVLSNLVDWSDRGTCILFGDGAGAAVITSDCSDIKIPFVLHADGTKGHVLSCHSRLSSKLLTYHPFIAMDGKAIYKFAVRQVTNVIKEVVEKAGKELEEIDFFLLHQANKRIIESIANHLHQDIAKFPMNMMENGNMSSASIPVLLDDLKKQGKLAAGTKIVIAGFGAGLTWGSTYLEI